MALCVCVDGSKLSEPGVMSEFWPEEQSEPSSAKIVKPSSSVNIVTTTGSESRGEDPPTVLSSFKPVTSIPPDAQSSIARELGGEMLAHYRLDDYIGVGGMGAVFRATDIRLDRPVALKILPAEQAKDPEIVARFQHEARAAARLDHENIARVFMVGEDRGLHFIAFEFVEGVNVRDLIQQCGPLPPHEVVNYALQITGALMHAVTRGVVHRDIKPSNIIVTLNGRAKLVDMGLARHFERRQDGGLTQSGVTLGTFDYISPEQARDPRTADVRSDVYSLGCTLFHMLTGRPPYPEGTVLQKLLKHQEETPPDARSHNPHVPANLAAVVTRMMAKDPARRFQTPQELLSDLLEIAASMGLKSSNPEGLIWVVEPPRASMTKTTWAIWLTAAAALVVSVIALNFRRDNGLKVAARPTTTREVATTDSVQSTAPSSETNRSPDEKSSNALSQSDTPPESSPQPSPSAVASTPDEPGAGSEPQMIVVNSEQDLRAAVEQAPSGSTIEIGGEYRPQRTHLVDGTAGIRIEGKRLTIKAAPGTRPRWLMAYDEKDIGATDWTMLTLVGSQVELEGIQFELEASSANSQLLAVLSLQSSQATLRRCSFVQTSSQPRGESVRRDGDPLVWVAQLDGGIAIGGQAAIPSKIVASECFFGGGQGGFYLDGPAKIEMTDCTLLGYRSTVLVKSLGFSSKLAAELRLTNVSIFGSGSPIFDLVFARALVHSQGVVYSHEAPTKGVLARIDADSRLDWRGKRNMFHGVRHYLVSRIGSETVPQAERLSDWIEVARDVDDLDSVETDKSPWLITLAEAAERSYDDPIVSDAFRLSSDTGDAAWRPVGSRFVLPWGPLYPATPLDASSRSTKPITVTRTDSPGPNDPGREPTTPESRPDKSSRSEPTTGTGRPGEVASGTKPKLEVNRIMNQPPGDAAGGSTQPGTVENRAPVESGPAVAAQKDILVVDPASSAAFHSLAEACARAEDGAVIEIRHAGKLREGIIELGDRHLTIRAGAGVRPTIEFAVNQADLRGRNPRLFDVRLGSLALRDVDLHMTVDPAVGAESWSLITSRSADVNLENCTVTVDAPLGSSTNVLRLLANDMDDPMTAPAAVVNPPRPQFQVRNCMIVGAGGLVRLQPAVRLRVELENCAIETLDNLLTVAGGMDRVVFGAVNELEIRRSTIRLGRSLVSYEASETRTGLPRLEVNAADNILVGVGPENAPWIRFRSPKPADELRGLLRWKGMNNSYDGVDTFWEIESMVGETEVFAWDQWLKSPARDEIKAERRRLEFAVTSDTSQPWLRTRDHFRLDPSQPSEMASDGSSRGADLSLIPAPPLERERE
jgi:serine/threonine-protein kinase